MDPEISTEEAFKSELVALIPQLRAFARSLCRDISAGDDLAQDAVARAWQNRSKYQMGTNMKGWSFMILRNLFYSEKRRAWRSVGLDPDVAAQTLVAVTNADGNLELDELRRAIGMLPAVQREALVLIGAGGLSYEEAAQICGAALGTMKSRVSRARDALALIYADGAIEADGQSPDLAAANILEQVQNYKR